MQQRDTKPAPSLIPAKRSTVLIFDDARFEEVLFLLQVHRFRHPGKRIFGLGENRSETDLRATAVGDEVHVLLAKAGIQTQEAARHRVPPVSRLEFGRFADHIAHLVLKGRRPQMRVLDLDLVDHIDTEVQVDALVAQNVLILLGNADHLVAPAEREAFVATTLQLLEDPRFAALFAPGSRAEVPIVGRLTRPDKSPILLSGQIDRLAVTASEVLIGDYKTNRPAPRTLDEAERAHPAYVRQLALYRALVGKLYPGRIVRAALIWTDVPDLMEISGQALDQALTSL